MVSADNNNSSPAYDVERCESFDDKMLRNGDGDDLRAKQRRCVDLVESTRKSRFRQGRVPSRCAWEVCVPYEPSRELFSKTRMPFRFPLQSVDPRYEFYMAPVSLNVNELFYGCH